MVIDLYVDADACPMKDEVYQVAARYGLRVFLVANTRMRVPRGAGVEMVVVDDGLDAADDWIAENIQRADVAVTADIPLAARCLEQGARVLGTDGRQFDEDMIGAALSTREFNSQLREGGVMTGGPSGISERKRSRFMSALDQLVQLGLRDMRE